MCGSLFSSPDQNARVPQVPEPAKHTLRSFGPARLASKHGLGWCAVRSGMRVTAVAFVHDPTHAPTCVPARTHMHAELRMGRLYGRAERPARSTWVTSVGLPPLYCGARRSKPRCSLAHRGASGPFWERGWPSVRPRGPFRRMTRTISESSVPPHARARRPPSLCRAKPLQWPHLARAEQISGAHSTGVRTLQNQARWACSRSRILDTARLDDVWCALSARRRVNGTSFCGA